VAFPGGLADPVSLAVLAFGSDGGYVTTPAGIGLKGTAVNQGASVIAPDSLKFSGPVSLFWFGEVFGNPSGATVYIGVSYDNADNNPFVAYAIGRGNGSSDFSFYYNNAGGFGFSDFTGAPTSGVHSFLMVAETGVRLFVDGVDRGTVAGFNGTPSYGATALLEFGSHVPASRYINANSVVGYIWNRALTPTEAWRLHLDPFCLIRPPRRLTVASITTVDIGHSPGSKDLVISVFSPEMGVLLFPDADITDGSWTDQDGGTNLFAAIDEPVLSDSDYIKSSSNPVNDVCEVRLSDPGSAPSQPFEVFYRYKKSGGATIDLIVKLVQGTTVIATWTHNDISSSFVTASQVLSGGEFASITDFNDLRIRFEADIP